MPTRDDKSEDELSLAAGDSQLFERIDALWKFWSKVLSPLDMPRGVRKFRSVEEMNAFKERYENERDARFRAEHRELTLWNLWCRPSRSS